MLINLIKILSLPIVILNFAGGIIGGIWLAFLGEWKLIGIGLILIFTLHWAITILMMIALPISSLAIYCYKRNKLLGHFFGFISQVYTNLLIVATCVFAFFLCSNFYKGEKVGLNLIPYLLWSWGMALGDWQYLASKEQHNEFTAITIFSASAFYFLFLVSIFISPTLAFIVAIIFLIIQLIILPIHNLYIANKLMNYTEF